MSLADVNVIKCNITARCGRSGFHAHAPTTLDDDENELQ